MSETRVARAERESLEGFAPLVDMELDALIRRPVLILRRAGIETYESCSGEPGHAFREPTIRFCGGAARAYQAFTASIEHGLPVVALRPVCFQVVNGNLAGPFCEITFDLEGLRFLASEWMDPAENAVRVAREATEKE